MKIIISLVALSFLIGLICLCIYLHTVSYKKNRR